MKMKKRNIVFWEEVLKDLPESYKIWFKKEKDYLQKNIIKDSKVLEVGCGNGRTLKDIINITTNLTGIDHDAKAIQDAKLNFKNFSDVHLLVAQAEKLPFKDKSFDFVICMTTFANFGKKKFIILDEMKRVLQDNGKIIISVFSEDAFNERMKLYKNLNAPIKKIKEGGKIIFDESLGDNVSEQFSENELKEIFKKAKLKIIEIIKLNMAYICKLKK